MRTRTRTRTEITPKVGVAHKIQNSAPFCIFEGKTCALYTIILEYTVAKHSMGVLRMCKSPLLTVVH